MCSVYQRVLRTSPRCLDLHILPPFNGDSPTNSANKTPRSILSLVANHQLSIFLGWMNLSSLQIVPWKSQLLKKTNWKRDDWTTILEVFKLHPPKTNTTLQSHHFLNRRYINSFIIHGCFSSLSHNFFPGGYEHLIPGPMHLWHMACMWLSTNLPHALQRIPNNLTKDSGFGLCSWLFNVTPSHNLMNPKKKSRGDAWGGVSNHWSWY